MRKADAYVRIPYYYYSPHAVVLGLRRAPTIRSGDEAELLASMVERNDGWQTLSYCRLEAVSGWIRGRGCAITPILTVPGSLDHELPDDVWTRAS